MFDFGDILVGLLAPSSKRGVLILLALLGVFVLVILIVAGLMPYA